MRIDLLLANFHHLSAFGLFALLSRVSGNRPAYPRIESRTAPFSCLRLMGTKMTAPKGYTPAALTRWRGRAQTLARDGDVFLYLISGAKERNPQAAALAVLANL